MKPVIAYYPTGPVHMRNLALLARALPQFAFRVFYRTRHPWFAPDKLAQYPYERVCDLDDRVPDELFQGDVRALVLAIAAAERMIGDLIENALEHDIPIIAIEEVVQLALNDNRINHYVMPVDHLMAASEKEKERFIQSGVRPEKVHVTGWPFYSGLLEKPSDARKRELRANLALPQDKRIATLCLSKLRDVDDASPLETPSVRQQILSVCARGLPADYHLAVKLHPVESLESGCQIIAPVLPNATIIRGDTPISNVLDASDVCLSRGNSQVVLESILRSIPALAIPAGIRTILDEIPDAVARNAAQLRGALARLSSGTSLDYAEVIRQHFPLQPEDALRKVADCIEDIAANRRTNRDFRDWTNLALMRGFMNEPQAGIGLILNCLLIAGQAAGPVVRALVSLLQRKAAASDIQALIADLGSAQRTPIIVAMYIRQLERSSSQPTAEDWSLIEEHFPCPPDMNAHYYIRYFVALCGLYLAAGRLNKAKRLLQWLKAEYGFNKSVRELAGRDEFRAGYKLRRALRKPYSAAKAVAKAVLPQRTQDFIRSLLHRK